MQTAAKRSRSKDRRMREALDAQERDERVRRNAAVALAAASSRSNPTPASEIARRKDLLAGGQFLHNISLDQPLVGQVHVLQNCPVDFTADTVDRCEGGGLRIKDKTLLGTWLSCMCRMGACLRDLFFLHLGLHVMGMHVPILGGVRSLVLQVRIRVWASNVSSVLPLRERCDRCNRS